MQKKFFYLLGITIIVLLILPEFYKPAQSVLPLNNKELVINVIPLNKQNVTITNQYVGYVVPIKSVSLISNVSGYIDEIWAEGGQEVNVGDNLVLIDQREYKAQLDAAKSAVAQANADFINAKSYYNRMKKAGKKAVSASVLDDAKAKFLSAKAALQKAAAEEQKALVMYDYTVLQAPINGIIGNVELTRGNYVAPSSGALLSIIQFNPIRVMFSISDKEYLNEITKHPDGKLFDGDEIKIKLANGKIYPSTGKFKFADNQINKTTNSISIFADFDIVNKELLANSYVDVLLSQKFENVFLIRQNYVTLNNDGAFAYVMKKNVLKQVPLKIVGYLGNDYVVENDFANDEFLVVDKIGRIAEGTKLKINITNVAEDK